MRCWITSALKTWHSTRTQTHNIVKVDKLEHKAEISSDFHKIWCKDNVLCFGSLSTARWELSPLGNSMAVNWIRMPCVWFLSLFSFLCTPSIPLTLKKLSCSMSGRKPRSYWTLLQENPGFANKDRKESKHHKFQHDVTAIGERERRWSTHLCVEILQLASVTTVSIKNPAQYYCARGVQPDWETREHNALETCWLG